MALLWLLYLAIGAAAVIHERREVEHANRGARLDKDAVFPIRIGLQQNNLERGYDYLMKVSHPSSSEYGKHWTVDEVNAVFQPSEEAYDSLKSWLVESGIPVEAIRSTPNRGWIAIDLPASHAERLFETEFYEYNSPMDDSVRIGCDEYSLPDHISKHVDYITPGITLSPPMERSVVDANELTKRDQWGGPGGGVHGPGHWYPGPIRGPPYHGPWHKPPGGGNLPPELQDCGRNITPPCIRALYDIPFPRGSVAGNDLGVFEFGDIYSQKDLNDFFTRFAPYVPNGTHPTLNSINGAQAPVPPGDPRNTGESDIDLDLGFSLIYPQGIQLYQVKFPNGVLKKGSPAYLEQLTFLTPFFDAIDGSFCTDQDRKFGYDCGTVELTKVLTVSYSSPELDNTQKSTVRTCNEVMKLSLQGHTILFSSGDYGVASHPNYLNTNGCVPKSLNISARDNGPIFSPQFPSDCPYILSVGGTQLNSNDTVYDAESAMNVPGLSPYPNAVFSSSGGFANFFTVPDYQKSAVSNYFAKYNPGYASYVYNGVDLFHTGSSIGANGGVYNRNGRGYPDVSANGAHLAAYNNDTLYHFYGTSLSSPIFASILTLINGERSKAGKSSVGFVHPVFYEHPEIFNDITNGTNPGCGTPGFASVPGWDPVTGLGTPNYEKMKDLFLSLP